MSSKTRKTINLDRFRPATKADLIESTGNVRNGRIVWHASISGLTRYTLKSHEHILAYMVLIKRKELWVERIWEKQAGNWGAVNRSFVENGIANGVDLTDEEGKRILLVDNGFWIKIHLGYKLNYNGKKYVVYDDEIPILKEKQLSLFKTRH